MKKIILLISMAFAINAAAQTADKYPDFVLSYSFDGNNDSVPLAKTSFEYNQNNRIVKETSISQQDDTTTILRTYDDSNRLIAALSNYNGFEYHKKIWIYDEVNAQIDYYELGSDTAYKDQRCDSTHHYVYSGVRDFYTIEDISAFTAMVGMDMEFRECDSIYIDRYIDSTQTWTKYSHIYPVYTIGKPDSARVELFDIDLALFFPIPNRQVDIVFALKFTYNSGRLIKLTGELRVQLNVLYHTIPDVLILTKTYNNEGWLETATKVVDFKVPGGPEYQATQQRYAYDGDRIVSISHYTADTVDVWELVRRDWYYEKEDNAIVGIAQPAHVSIYPNPVKDCFYIDNLTESAQVSVYDMSGKRALVETMNGKQGQIQTAMLPAGIYTVKIEEKQRVQIVKIVKL
jgi:hypothetical protein